MAYDLVNFYSYEQPKDITAFMLNTNEAKRASSTIRWFAQSISFSIAIRICKVFIF